MKKASEVGDAVTDWSWLFAMVALVAFILDIFWITRAPKRVPLPKGAPPSPLRSAGTAGAGAPVASTAISGSTTRYDVYSLGRPYRSAVRRISSTSSGVAPSSRICRERCPIFLDAHRRGT